MPTRARDGNVYSFKRISFFVVLFCFVFVGFNKLLNASFLSFSCLFLACLILVLLAPTTLTVTYMLCALVKVSFFFVSFAVFIYIHLNAGEGVGHLGGREGGNVLHDTGNGKTNKKPTNTFASSVPSVW